jgi:membrane-associated phospholipid phosphatase
MTTEIMRIGHESTTSEVDSPGYTFRGTWRSAFAVVLLLAVPACAARWWLDEPLALATLHLDLPHFVFTMIDHSEVFGDGCGVLFFIAAVWMLDPARRRCLPRLMAAGYGSGLAVNVVKLCIARPRPFYWMEQRLAGGAQFGDWFPLASNGSAWQSFPSGHTATAVGLALALSSLYPRGRALFATLAVLVASQRVVNDMHYVSDVLAATAVAWLTTTAMFRYRPIADRFDRFERNASTHTPPSASVKTRAAA